MEGRALSRDRKSWSWLVAWFSAAVAAIVSDLLSAPRVSHFVVGLGTGVIWQLLHRRDLTSRLTFMAVYVTVGVSGMLATRSKIEWNDMNTVGLLGIGVLLGLIYTEHFRRWQDRTAWRRDLPRTANSADRVSTLSD